ncbi:MAG TPA: hypothetical protein PLF40_00330 [Kofleriaceae bacterium]|nr:hypothetical protein [Kofleriaceae bacterium]
MNFRILPFALVVGAVMPPDNERFSGGYHSGLRYYTSNSILPAGTMLNVVGA